MPFISCRLGGEKSEIYNRLVPQSEIPIPQSVCSAIQNGYVPQLKGLLEKAYREQGLDLQGFRETI